MPLSTPHLTLNLFRNAPLILSKDTVQRAWCFFDLARTLTWQRAPSSNIQDAFQNAIDLLPYEKTFREAYDKWRSYNRSR